MPLLARSVQAPLHIDVAFLLEGRVHYAGSVHDLKLRTRQLNLERAIAVMMRERAA